MVDIAKHVGSDAISNVARWYDDVEPYVSIVILNFNKHELTHECLEHIWRHTTGLKYEIIVVDNGSRADDFAKLVRKHGRYRLIRLKRNRFFGEGNNIGVEQARGELICFLNNDAFVTVDWLLPLCRVLNESWKAGGVGPRFVYPDGRLQEVGAFIDEQGRSYQVGKAKVFDQDDLRQTRIVDYCSAACFLLRRQNFLDLGGFDYVFEPAYYEDADLCFKLTETGLFIYCCPASLVVHVENATTATHRTVLGNHTVEQNRQLFVTRWKDVLDKRSRNAPTWGGSLPRAKPLWLAKRPQPQGRVAFYTSYDLTLGGGERYLLSAAAVAGTFADVFLVTEYPYSQARLTSMSNDLALDLSAITVLPLDRVHELCPVDVCIIMSNEILPPIQGFGRRNYFLCQFPFPITDEMLAAYWPHIDGIDGYVCYSSFVNHHIGVERSKLGISNAIPIEIIAPPVPQFPVAREQTLAAGCVHMILIGRFFTGGHNKRHDVAIECVKRLVADGYDVQLHLVGSVATSHPSHVERLLELRESAQGYPIQFYPNAENGTIERLLALCSIYLHAAGFDVDIATEPHRCEHFGISVLEAMSAGCVPFVVNNGGPSEFVDEDQSGFVYETLDELVLKVAKLINSPEEFGRLSRAARAMSQQFAYEVFSDRWKRFLSPKVGL